MADEDCIQSSANIKSCSWLIQELDSFWCSREPSFSIIIRIPKQMIRYYSSRAVYIDENTTSLYDLWKKNGPWFALCIANDVIHGSRSTGHVNSPEYLIAPVRMGNGKKSKRVISRSYLWIEERMDSPEILINIQWSFVSIHDVWSQSVSGKRKRETARNKAGRP